MIKKEAWHFYRTSSGVRLCWELEEPKGPEGPSHDKTEAEKGAHMAGRLTPILRPRQEKFDFTTKTVELIFTLEALFPQGGPVQDPVLTERTSHGRGFDAHFAP